MAADDDLRTELTKECMRYVMGGDSVYLHKALCIARAVNIIDPIIAFPGVVMFMPLFIHSIYSVLICNLHTLRPSECPSYPTPRSLVLAKKNNPFFLLFTSSSTPSPRLAVGLQCIDVAPIRATFCRIDAQSSDGLQPNDLRHNIPSVIRRLCAIVATVLRKNSSCLPRDASWKRRAEATTGTLHVPSITANPHTYSRSLSVPPRR